MIKQKVVHEQIDAERQRQESLWGEQNHNERTWLAILLEEVGEVARAINEYDEIGYETELLQVAAVCVAMLESLRRNGWML